MLTVLGVDCFICLLLSGVSSDQLNESLRATSKLSSTAEQTAHDAERVLEAMETKHKLKLVDDVTVLVVVHCLSSCCLICRSVCSCCNCCLSMCRLFLGVLTFTYLHICC